MQTKSRPAHIEATIEDGADEGVFEAIVSVFGNVDSYGDMVMPGAFSDSLAEWGEKGDPIPVLWSHNSYDPASHIGYVEKAEERDEGLWIRGRLDIHADPAESKARQVWRLLKGRRVTQFSFAYDILDAAEVRDEGRKVYELRKLKLYEVGPTLVGVNQDTELLDTKALRRVLDDVKAGRVLSKKNEDLLRNAHAAIGDVLATLESDDDGKATASVPAKTEEPAKANVEEPTRSPATIRLATELELAAL
jgi:HK97 family phage prohead protease